MEYQFIINNRTHRHLESRIQSCCGRTMCRSNVQYTYSLNFTYGISRFTFLVSRHRTYNNSKHNNDNYQVSRFKVFHGVARDLVYFLFLMKKCVYTLSFERNKVFVNCVKQTVQHEYVSYVKISILIPSCLVTLTKYLVFEKINNQF